MQTNLRNQVLCILLLAILYCQTAQAQLSLSGQLRTRSELRDGQGTLSPQEAVPAFFTSQRARLNLGYTGDRFKVFTAIQDVRVWGQDASSINRVTLAANNGLMVHEAWGEVMLLDTAAAIENLSLKIGRQELVYDDGRLLGNLDWLQQGRRHELVLLKLENKGWIGHVGVAFNQNQEYKTGTLYNGMPNGYQAGTNGIGILYKSMQFLYAGRKFNQGSASFLLLKDDFNKYHPDSTGKILDPGVWSRLTTGVYFSSTLINKLGITASAYVQRGRTKDGEKLAAHLFSAATMYAVSPFFSLGPGIDYTSGNNPNRTDGVNRMFDPLYGTPHKFWGNMDYFYAADRFGNNGLIDFYLKSRYKINNLTFSFDAHQFKAANPVMNKESVRLERNFGTELDLVVNYSFTKTVNFEGGYSTFFATPTLASEAVKNVINADRQANWAYLMINIKPTFLSK